MEMKTISELRNEYSITSGYKNPNDISGVSNDVLNRWCSMLKRNIAKLEGAAKESGYILDPQWAQYSYEEILQMEENGVVIPKEVLEIAHAMQEADVVTYQIELSNAEQEQAVEDDNETQKTDDTATKKASFFELVAKTSAKIELSEEKQDQINDEIEKLTPIANDASDKKNKIIEQQKNALEKLKKIAEEWDTLKQKVDKGETLTKSEQKRYEQLSELFESQSKENQQYSDQTTNEIKEITKSLEAIDSLAQKGYQIGSETTDLGNQLKDFTSPSNYKTVHTNIATNIGTIGAILAMSQGKRIAQEAVSVGTDTQIFSNDTQITVNEIATILDLKKPLSGNTTEPSENNNSDNQNKLDNAKPENSSQENDRVEEETTINDENETTTEKIIDTSNKNINLIPTSTSSTTNQTQTVTQTPQIPTAITANKPKTSNPNSNTKSKKTNDDELDASNGEEAAKELKGETPGAKNAGKETKKQSNEMDQCDKKTQKTDKKLKKDEKALQKQLKKDEKLLKDNEKKVEETTRKIEEEQLEAEIIQQQISALEEVVNSGGQNGTTNNNVNPTTAFGIGTPQTNTSNTNNNGSSNNIENSLIQIETLKGSLEYKAASVELNGQKLYTLQKVSNKTIVRMKKTNTQYNKTVKATQKQLIKDQQEGSKVLQFANRVEGICSPIATTGTIVKTTGQILSKIVAPPWIPIIGAVMEPVGALAEAIGNYGVAAANVTKTVCYALDGNLVGALTSAATAIMSGASAVGATKEATAGFQNLSKNIAGAQARAAAVQGAKEAAKQGASASAVEAMKGGASKEFADVSTDQLMTQAKQGAELGVSEATKQQGLQASKELMQRSTYEATTSGIKELGSSSFKELASSASSGLNALGNVFANKNNEETKAKASTGQVLYKPNTQKINQIKKSVQIQKVGFGNYYSQSNSGGGLNKRR